MMKKLQRILTGLLIVALFNVTALTAHAATTSIFDGYTVTVLDKATPAVTVYGRTTDRNVMCFMSAQGQEVGAISYGEYNAIAQKHRRLIYLPGTRNIAGGKRRPLCCGQVVSECRAEIGLYHTRACFKKKKYNHYEGL